MLDEIFQVHYYYPSVAPHDMASRGGAGNFYIDIGPGSFTPPIEMYNITTSMAMVQSSSFVEIQGRQILRVAHEARILTAKTLCKSLLQGEPWCASENH